MLAILYSTFAGMCVGRCFSLTVKFSLFVPTFSVASLIPYGAKIAIIRQ